MADKTKAVSTTEEILQKRAKAEGIEIEMNIDPANVADDDLYLNDEDLIIEDTLPEPEIGEEEAVEIEEEITVGEIYEEPEAIPVINEHIEIYHIMRTVGRTEQRELGILTGASLDNEITSYLESGFEIIDALAAGYSADGDRILFILGRRADGQEGEYKKMHLIKRTIGIGAGAVTGFSADLWLNHHIQDLGWKLLKILPNGAPPEGINMLWVMVK